MFQKEDIVAIFGESLSENVIHNSHSYVFDPDINEPEINSFMINSIKPIICRVCFSFVDGKEEGLIVKKLSIGKEAKPILVSAKQARLVQRNGIEVDKKKAIFIAINEESNCYETFSSLNSAKAQLDSWGSEYSGDDECNWQDYDMRLFKAIDISSEV